MKILAIIPARGGSKGVKDKNIKELNGKPLIAWTIEAAKKSKYIDRLVVTTEDDRIARVAKEYGAEVPFKRPLELAADDTPGIAPILHTVEYLKEHEDYSADYIILLQCTSPLRTEKHIDQSIELIFNNNEDSLVSVTKVVHPPYWNKVVDKNGYLKQFIPYDEMQKTRRQDFEEVFRLNGAIYICKSELLMKEKSFLAGQTLPFVISEKESVDIDEEFDFKLAEFLFNSENLF